MARVKFFINILIIFIVIYFVFYSFCKILSNNKTNQKFKSEPALTNLSIQWEKNNYTVPLNNILINPNQKLYAGNFYHVIQMVNDTVMPEKCYLGFMKLSSIKKDRYVFFEPKNISNSTLFKYSQIINKKIMIYPILLDNGFNKENIINCQEWVKIVNNNVKYVYDKKGHERILNINKCIYIPRKKYLKIESLDSTVFKVEYDAVYNKVKICSIGIGKSEIELTPVNGLSALKIVFKSFNNVNKLKQSQKNHNISSKSMFFKILPGWL